MKFEATDKLSRDEALTALDSDDVEAICRTLVSISLHDEEPFWAQKQCERFASHPTRNIREVVATCYAHLGRFRKSLDVPAALPVLSELATDPIISDHVDDCVEDIAFGLKLVISRDAQESYRVVDR